MNKLFYDNNTGKPFNGLHEKFYQNGKLSSQVEYSNGVRNGMDKAWWEDGNPKHILNYKIVLKTDDLNTTIATVFC